MCVVRMFNKNGFIVWLPVVRVLYLMTQKGPTTPFFLTWSSSYIGMCLSIHYILFTAETETGLQ